MSDKCNKSGTEALAAATGSPFRVVLSREAGWRIPPNTVVVSRPSKWGNPYKVGIDGDQAHCVYLFYQRYYGRTASGEMEDIKDAYKASARRELAGKNLACWCKLDEPCHADVLLDMANSRKDEPDCT